MDARAWHQAFREGSVAAAGKAVAGGAACVVDVRCPGQGEGHHGIRIGVELRLLPAQEIGQAGNRGEARCGAGTEVLLQHTFELDQNIGHLGQGIFRVEVQGPGRGFPGWSKCPTDAFGRCRQAQLV